MGFFEKYLACTQWVLGEQIASELTMNSPCTHWVSAPLPSVNVTHDGPFIQFPISHNNSLTKLHEGITLSHGLIKLFSSDCQHNLGNSKNQIK